MRRGKGLVLPALAATLIAASMSLIGAYVPTEESMGVVQKIFYIHVPLAWVAFLAFFVVFVASMLYLWKRDRRWDFRAAASAEVGLVFTTLVLITGPIWAKSAWGAWWTWDMRLTTTLVLWFIYAAYFAVRGFVNDEERAARYGAVVGVIGFLDVPIVAIAILLSRTQHPGPVVFEGGLTGSMLLTLLVSLAAFTALYAALVTSRASANRTRDDIVRLRQDLED